MSKDFYLYVYLDPRKSGRYCYETVCFLHEPIYVGKGKGTRYISHVKESTVWNIKSKNIKHNKINKIISSGYYPIIDILMYDSEIDILRFEENLINDIGRIVNNSGPLCNIRATSWCGNNTKTVNRIGNGLAGFKFATIIDPVTGEMFQVKEDQKELFRNAGFRLADAWVCPKQNNSKSRRGKNNPMYGKSAVKGRKWVTILSTGESRLLTTKEIENLSENFKYGRTVCKNNRRRVIIKGEDKARYMSEDEIKNLPVGTQYQFGLQWKNNREIYNVQQK